MSGSMRLPFIRGRARQVLKQLRDDVWRWQSRREAREESMTFAAVVRRADVDQRRLLLDRMAVLLRALDEPVPNSRGPELREAVERAVSAGDVERIWLALAVLTGRLPEPDDVVNARRRLSLGDAGSALGPALAAVVRRTRRTPLSEAPVEVHAGVVLMDVDFTAKHDAQTGIQRVVRRLAPRWHREHGVEFAVWTDEGDALRGLHQDEQERVLRWLRPLQRPLQAGQTAPLVVPWRSTVVLPEVPALEHCARLTCLARHSGNRVVAVAHDCIPAFSADLMTEPMEPIRFVHYLSVIKHAEVLAGVSASAAAEFGGFTRALSAQGLTGPRVVSCPLGTDPPSVAASPAAPAPGANPEVLVVGSHEPRKNHLAVLHAAEVLWRQGLSFRLHFVGAAGGSWTAHAFDRRVAALARAGRSVRTDRGLDDEKLWAAYAGARFTVFPSLHEGFGLPVLESLTLGTPVLATRYGSVGELADEGGMVLVDPRDDDALAEAMGSLLVDDERVAQLRKQALERPPRSWDDYARDLWQLLVVAQ